MFRKPGMRRKGVSRPPSPPDGLRRVGSLAFASWVSTYQEGMIRCALTHRDQT